jgi:hypothetical protein
MLSRLRIEWGMMAEGFESLPHRFIRKTRQLPNCITFLHNKDTVVRRCPPMLLDMEFCATSKPNSTQPGEPAPYPERERAEHLGSSTSKSHARLFAAY